MKTLLSILLLSASFVMAEQKSWDTPPKKGELYMYVQVYRDAKEELVYTYIISQYNPDDPAFQIKEAGWFEVTPWEVWQWINSPIALGYIPWDWTGEIEGKKEEALTKQEPKEEPITS